MRILLECGTYEPCNMGDVTMLQVAVKRLKGLWPDASITVITAAPDRLRAHCPDVQALRLGLREGRRLAMLEGRGR